ncbi:response regulator transcription factor [Paenibacillus sp. GCM10012306]|uniref:response regulator transcription factor n=1 Tax=Paenibacillus sp. GCM10012306 TaxID=3317342 RepID=UPI00361310C4
MQKDILIVEDDMKIRKLLRLYLEKEGYGVMEAQNGEEAKVMFQQDEPCFLITDLMMPKFSGEQLCQWIRHEQKSDIPIIMLTAKITESERIAGLQMGADDYIIKPFSPQEVVVRVNTILKRMAHRCSKISYRGLTIKTHSGEVKYNGVSIALTQHEFKLLHLLMKHPNQILSREQILNELYPNDERSVIDRTVDVHVGKLREKIEVSCQTPSFFQTVRGMGYRFVAY